MGPRPWKPASELKGALERGDLRFAVTLAREVTEDRHGRPIDLDLALRFLPLVAEQQPEHYDGWARRWLARWMDEAPAPSISSAADVAAALTDLPMEPVAAREELERLTGGS
jgi:hypothetical protein